MSKHVELILDSTPLGLTSSLFLLAIV